MVCSGQVSNPQPLDYETDVLTTTPLCLINESVEAFHTEYNAPKNDHVPHPINGGFNTKEQLNILAHPISVCCAYKYSTVKVVCNERTQAQQQHRESRIT